MSAPLNPIISVVIPCYNYARYLPQCLDSLVNQKFREWECVLVNNGSVDNTAEICRQYIDKDRRFIYLETINNGPSAARNEGIRIAKGKYIQFLDADDMLEDNKLFFQSEFLEKSPETDLIYGDSRYFTDKNILARSYSMKMPDKEWMPKISGRGNHMIWALLKYNIMSIHAPLFRRSIFDKVGMMDETLYGYEDWELWLRMALNKFTFLYSPGPSTFSLIRSHSGSLNKNLLNMRRYLLSVWWKCIKSGNLSIQFFPYVMLRIEEEFLITIVDAIIHRDFTLAGGKGLTTFQKIIMYVLLPLFIPFIFIVRILRKLK